MRKSGTRTEVLNCDVAEPANSVSPARETAFEKQRGVSRVEQRPGFSQVNVTNLAEPIVESRLHILRAITEAQISIDFLKLTPGGMSFLIRADESEKLGEILSGNGADCSINADRTIVLVHAVNIRDEEGLLAEIVKNSIASGAQIDHVGDGHDRLLLVAPNADAASIANFLETSLVGK